MKVALTSVLVAGLLSLLGGGVMWINEVHGLARANTRELKAVREYAKTLKSIDKRLARMEGALGVSSE